ncbi:MAG: ABC-type dipeptide transport system, periplasmic component [Aeromicrobium sp.]|nr:ABC-type dipeptide transport system, periplasmic component [Aeromicrobium sp.]
MSTSTPSGRRGRSRASAALAGTVTIGLLLAACGTGSDSSGDDAAGDPVSGGTLKFAINSDTNCLDPHQSPADIAGFFSRPILDSLVALNQDGSLDPWLATDWKVSDDQKTYSFTLRDDVTFSNGEKFDGDAVKANLDHIVDPATKSQLAANTIATYTSTKVVDPTHVEVSFSEPNSAFLPSLATAYLGIEAPSTLKQSPDKLCAKIVGTGPFVSKVGYTPAKGISYTRNDDYRWGPGNAKHEGKAYLEAVDIQIITEDSSRYGALTSKQVDAIGGVPPVNVAQLKKTPGFKVETTQAPGGNYNYYPHQAKGRPFADLKVREAFRAGIDWDTLVDKRYFGVFQAAKGPLAPTTVGYDKSVESSYTFDKAKADQLLDDAGWSKRDSDGYRVKDGKRLTLVHPFLKAFAREQRDTLLEQVQSSAKELGIEYKVENISIDEFYDRLYTGNYDVLDTSWQRASPDSLRTLFGKENIPGPGKFGTNFGHYDNDVVNKALKTALEEVDLDKQGAAYATAQQQITKDAAVFPVYVFNYVLGHTDQLHDVAFEPQAYPTFYDAWKSK